MSSIPWYPVSDPYNLKFLLIDNKGVAIVPEPRPDAISFWEHLGLADTTPAILPNHYQHSFHHETIATNHIYDNDYEPSNILDYFF